MAISYFERESSVNIIAAYEDGTIVAFDLGQSVPVAECKLHTETVLAMDVSHSSLQGVSGGADNRICRFSLKPINDVLDVVCEGVTKVLSPGTGDVRWRHDDKLIFAGGWDGK
jgi:WD40 repeat protein